MAKVQEIVSEMKTIHDLLIKDSTAYYIPDFQRDFVWNKEDVDQLFNDLLNDTDSFKMESDDLEGYLLGNIVLIDDPDKNQKQVIDGQQRLTTLTLIAKALFDVINDKIDRTQGQEKNSWIQRLADLGKAFSVMDDDNEFISLKILHAPALGFGGYYKKLIIDKASDEDLIKEADYNIKEIYTTSFDFIQGLDDKQLKKFIIYYRDKIKLIETTAPTEAKAFQLFEILNDRGRTLEPMDLIKNRFLQTLNIDGKPDDVIDDFNQEWREMMENLQPKKSKSQKNKYLSSTVFLRQYLLAVRGENIYTKDLFDYFKETGRFNGEEILVFVKGMKKASKVYANIETEDYSDYNNDRNMYVLNKLLGIKQFHPILILFYNEDVSKKTIVLDALTRLGAAIVFSYNQTNSIEKMLPDLIKSYLSKKKKDSEEAFKQLINDLEKMIEDYAGIAKSILVERNHVGKNGDVNAKAGTILKFIEFYFNQNNNIRSLPSKKKLTVEHILSRSLDLDSAKITNQDLGFESDKQKEDYMHRIGNLTLLYNTDNSAVGNSIFAEKLEIYKKSQFIITSTIVEPLATPVKNGQDTAFCNLINQNERNYEPVKGQWTRELIEKRSGDIATLVYRILTKKEEN